MFKYLQPFDFIIMFLTCLFAGGVINRLFKNVKQSNYYTQLISILSVSLGVSAVNLILLVGEWHIIFAAMTFLSLTCLGIFVGVWLDNQFSRFIGKRLCEK